jgi:hypothetical protein
VATAVLHLGFKIFHEPIDTANFASSMKANEKKLLGTCDDSQVASLLALADTLCDTSMACGDTGRIQLAKDVNIDRVAVSLFMKLGMVGWSYVRTVKGCDPKGFSALMEPSADHPLASCMP